MPIAVVDEGVFVDHRDFADRGILKWGSSWDNAHGTHVAGILGATGNNNKDVAGVNWKAPLWFYEVGGLWGDQPAGPVSVNGVLLSALQQALVLAALDGAKLVN
jgi:subtilisin family serine protease